MNGLGFRRASILLATALILAACGQEAGTAASPTPLPVVIDESGTTAEGRLEPVRFVQLAAAVSGQVSEVLAAEGEQVQAGQLIARMDGPEAITLESARTAAATELAASYQDLRTAQNHVDTYPLPRIFAGMSPEQTARTWLAELDAARAAFAPYKETSRKTLKPRDAFPNLVYPSLPGRVVYDTGEYDGVALEYKKRVDVAWTNYTKAVTWLKLNASLEMAKARQFDAQTRYDRLKDAAPESAAAGTRAALATAEIRAPFAGSITKLDLKPGESVQAGTPVVTIADLDGWVVKTTDLTEIDVTGIEAGMPVSVVLDALPGRLLEGTVIFVDPQYEDRQGDVLYAVSVLLKDQDPAMRWGMTAEVTFEG